MFSTKKFQGILLARVNFPLYVVKVLTERHILVAGGGGESKTGISNAVEIYELSYSSKYNTCVAKCVTHYDSKKLAFMNACIFNDGKDYILAGGTGGYCVLHKIAIISNNITNIFNNVSSNFNESDNECSGKVRRRTNSNCDNSDDKVKSGLSQSRILSSDTDLPVEFSIFEISKFQTDSDDKYLGPYQKVVRYNPSLNALVTGGADGHVKIWSYPDNRVIRDINAHNDEIDDIDINYQGTRIVSASHEGHSYVWNVDNGKKICELEYQMPIIKYSTKPIKYFIRRCRYGIIEGDVENYKLFTIMNPDKQMCPPHPSYLCKWETKRYDIEKLTVISTDLVLNMTLTDDGRFIGIGTQKGTVDVYVSFSLQRIYRMEKAHKFFITGLDFLKTCPETQLLTGDNDTSLISISVDNHIVVHNIPKQSTLGFFESIFAFTVTIVIIYFIMNYLGL